MKKNNYEIIEYDDKIIFEYLLNAKLPVYESTLLRKLNNLDSISSDKIMLYVFHFSLFHALYKMKKKYGKEGFYLHIDCMRISLKKISQKNQCQYFDEMSGCFCKNNTEKESLFCYVHKNYEKIYDNSLIFDPMQQFYENSENIMFVKDGKIFEIMDNIKNFSLNSGDLKNAMKIFDLKNFNKRSLRIRYIALSKKYHPDRSDGNNVAMKEINWAYSILDGVAV